MRLSIMPLLTVYSSQSAAHPHHQVFGTCFLLVPHVARLHRLGLAPGPGLTVTFLTWLVLAQGRGGTVITKLTGHLAPHELFYDVGSSECDGLRQLTHQSLI